MAKIIKRVEGRHETETLTGITCDKCGCGNSAIFVARSCNNPTCDGTQRPYTKEYERFIPGYVLIECACGLQMECSAFTETCDCGREYNWAGQELAPRCCWGEETGERF